MNNLAVLNDNNRAKAVVTHVALDVGEHGSELGLLADGSEDGIEVAVVAPIRAAPACTLRFSQRQKCLGFVAAQRMDLCVKLGLSTWDHVGFGIWVSRRLSASASIR